ncbi:hypothetical protein EDD36DRAFT_15632 [Exophiala viscosa]|uniref:Secreted protein n=1 Tax=Exophiala viscosa TaxID=2486360 RepID=A0AAN6E6D0_9EURO|nr:hypothetical protein EDD36DRAFT_15632 [Exophiala viscosa]
MCCVGHFVLAELRTLPLASAVTSPWSRALSSPLTVLPPQSLEPSRSCTSRPGADDSSLELVGSHTTFATTRSGYRYDNLVVPRQP